jgi:preprotein translocase subunit Sss1
MAATPSHPGFWGEVHTRIKAMSPTPEEHELIEKIKVNVLSWMAIGAIGGVLYLTYNVPRQLDEVLSNQRLFQGVQVRQEAEIKSIEARVRRLEEAR